MSAASMYQRADAGRCAGGCVSSSKVALGDPRFGLSGSLSQTSVDGDQAQFVLPRRVGSTLQVGSVELVTPLSVSIVVR